MEEREALKRQIELLQNLISRHKSVHGDAPFTGVDQRHPEAPTSVPHPPQPRSSRGGPPYAPHARDSWKKTYSLRNKNPQSTGGAPSNSVNQSSSHGLNQRETERETLQRERHTDSITASRGGGRETNERDIPIKKEAVLTRHEDGQGDSRSTGVRSKVTPELQRRTETHHVILPEKKEMPSPVKPGTSTTLPQADAKTSHSSKTNADTKKTATATSTPTTDKTVAPISATAKVSKPASVNPTSHTSAAILKKSKFTWVKSQNVKGVEAKQASSTITISHAGKAVNVTPTLVLKAGVASGSASLHATSKKTPPKKCNRKFSPISIAPKTSKYKWVSSSQAKVSRKSISPKEKGDPIKRPRLVPTPSPKVKKGMVGHSPSTSASSRYRWKAGGQSVSPAMIGASGTSRRRSAFHWTPERSNRNTRGGGGGGGGSVASPFGTQRSSFISPPGGFKLRSRMKIIRKSATSGAGSEKSSSPSSVKFSPRTRPHSWVRSSPSAGRRTRDHTKELVSIGRHKLRRLSPTSSRTSPPSSQRVFRSRYKMVTRPGSSTAHSHHHYNPALSWRAKRIQSARSFLQSRLRPDSQASSMCWIRGSLFRVSANKLSRTPASNMTINRTGRSYSPAHGSTFSPGYSRPYTTRHHASRAVQRSLAIIRLAHAKKEQPKPKQYCMYYNRFGKCNRGNSCPFIHDPDKVAVCTRFLRGTCKKADGTCPFSHKVAKEKMPVCSYFLRGICNNSECHYSHVYVSRKAEVCQDFVKGYCPEGEKCKKKHTLLCPDFSQSGSCPTGRRCKLQHRHRAKRTNTATPPPPGKRGRTREPAKRPCLSVVIPESSMDVPGVSQGAPHTPPPGSLALPSFISLSSSPEETDAPDTLPNHSTQVKEKKLQIKPRL